MNLLSIPIAEVRISHDRMRTDLGKGEDLAASLKQFGQLVPVIIDENNELIDGFRRYNAVSHLGSDTILAVRRESVSELLFRELELETNIQRKDLSWQERVKSIAELDRIRTAQDPSWTQTKTGAVAGLNQSEVSRAIRLNKMVELFPELKQAKSLKAANSQAEHLAKTVLRTKAVVDNPSWGASRRSSAGPAEATPHTSATPSTSPAPA